MQWEREGGGKGGTESINGFPRGGVNRREASGGTLEGNGSIEPLGFCL